MVMISMMWCMCFSVMVESMVTVEVGMVVLVVEDGRRVGGGGKGIGCVCVGVCWEAAG